MKDAQKPDHISLNTLIHRLKEGRFLIPDFQREFEWAPRDVRALMRSIFLDYYIGSLLLWKGEKENFSALSCESIYGYAGDSNPEHIVLDGQQRLTAMYYAFFLPDKPFPKRASRCSFYVSVNKLMNEEFDDAFGYEWLSKRWTKMLSSHVSQYENHVFPLSVLGLGRFALPNWLQEYEQYWHAKSVELENAGDDSSFAEAVSHTANAKAFGEHLEGITERYQISYIELDRSLALDKVCDIFTQINSRGVRLDIFDLMNALLRPKGLQLKYLWRNSASRLEFVETEKMNVYILQVMSILLQAYCSPKYLYYLIPNQPKSVRDPDGTRRKEVLVKNVQAVETHWHFAVGAIEDAVQILRHARG